MASAQPFKVLPDKKVLVVGSKKRDFQEWSAGHPDLLESIIFKFSEIDVPTELDPLIVQGVLFARRANHPGNKMVLELAKRANITFHRYFKHPSEACTFLEMCIYPKKEVKPMKEATEMSGVQGNTDEDRVSPSVPTPEPNQNKMTVKQFVSVHVKFGVNAASEIDRIFKLACEDGMNIKRSSVQVCYYELRKQKNKTESKVSETKKKRTKRAVRKGKKAPKSQQKKVDALPETDIMTDFIGFLQDFVEMSAIAKESIEALVGSHEEVQKQNVSLRAEIQRLKEDNNKLRSSIKKRVGEILKGF